MSARGHTRGDLPRQVVARDVSRDRARAESHVTPLRLVLEILGGLALLAAFALAWAVTS